MNKSPAFQFYPSDYLSDMKVRMLTWASKGVYMDLLCYCWKEGYIPSDSSAIAQLLACSDLAMIEPCLSLFEKHESDPQKLVHGRLDRERLKQEAFRKERAISGKRGAKERWKKDHGSAIKEPMAKNGSSVFSLQSSSLSSNNKTPTPFLVLPFQSDEFEKAWTKWVKHRSEIKKKLTPTSISQQFSEFKEMGEARAIAAINHTISKGWTGIREPENTLRPPQSERPLLGRTIND